MTFFDHSATITDASELENALFHEWSSVIERIDDIIENAQYPVALSTGAVAETANEYRDYLIESAKQEAQSLHENLDSAEAEVHQMALDEAAAAAQRAHAQWLIDNPMSDEEYDEKYAARRAEYDAEEAALENEWVVLEEHTDGARLEYHEGTCKYRIIIGGYVTLAVTDGVLAYSLWGDLSDGE